MSSQIVDTSGRPIRRPAPEHCPGCGEGKEGRVNAAGFGATTPDLYCGKCGFHFEGATE